MSIQQNIPVSETLLIKYLAGEANPEEAMAIDEWTELSADNKQLLEQYIRLWSHAGKAGTYIPRDLKQELDRLHQTGHKKPLLRTLFIRRAAAAVLISALGGMLLLYLQPWKKAHTPMLALMSAQNILRDTLADNSAVVLTPGSKLEHPVAFEGPDRTVLLQGEGYFSITPDVIKPFIVRVGTLGIKVIGTAFNVKTTNDSVTVQVDNGAVLFYDSRDSVIIKGGMQGVYTLATQTFSVRAMENGNNYGYATRTFRFQGTRLASVAEDLEKAYNVKFVFENKKLADCTITTAFNNMPIQYIMEVITASLSIRYRMEGSTIYLQGNECN